MISRGYAVRHILFVEISRKTGYDLIRGRDVVKCHDLFLWRNPDRPALGKHPTKYIFQLYKVSTILTTMNIISFEERTFEGIAAKFEYFVQRVDNLCRRHGEKKIDVWIDNHDVCRKLRISLRTLQTLRDNGTLAFSKIGNKTYYRPEDVEHIIKIVEDRRKEAKWRGRTI